MNRVTYPLALRWLAPVAALFLLAAPGRAEEKPADVIVELPKFVVTDSRALPPPESWRYARLPGFEILSNASDRTTQRLMTDFQLFREALDVVWPMPPQLNAPVLMILSSRPGQFQSFVPARTEGGPDTAKASVYLQGESRSAIVLDLETTVINLLSSDVDSAATGVDPTRFAIEHNKQLYREYVHYLLSRSKPRLPAWFEEGMAQIIMAMEFTPKWIEFGKLHDPNAVSPLAAMAAATNAANAASADEGDALPSDIGNAPAEDRDFNAALARRALMPLDRFFAVGYDAPEARNPLGNNTWAKEAYAFVHLGLFGENGRMQKPFTEFLLRSTREPVTEALFKECFKMSYRDMAIQLRGYIQFTDYKSKLYRAKGEAFLHADPVALRDATPAEVGRIKGQAMQLAGNAGAARTEFVAPYIRGERDPELLAALGLSEHEAGKHDRARALLTAAVAGHTKDPAAYFELARYRYADALASPGAAEARFSADQTTAVTSLLTPALTMPPPNVAGFELLADTYVRSAVRPKKSDLEPLVGGVRLFPGRMKLVYETAVLCADAGLNEAAHSLVDHGVKFAPDAATKARFEQLRTTLPAEAPTVTTPSATPGSESPKTRKTEMPK